MLTVKNKKSLHIALAALLSVSSLTGLVFVKQVHAASLTQVMVRFDTMHTSSFSSGAVCATPATVATEAKVVVTFPASFTVSTTTSNWTVDVATTTTWPSSSTAWPGIGTATAVSGQSVTFPSTDLTVGTRYCFNWTNTSAALQQPSSANTSEGGSVTTQTSTPTAIDTAQYATSTIANDTITVNATVPPTFSLALANTTDNLNTLSSSALTSSTTPATATVGTNAKNGWMVWAKDANTGMRSTVASKTIASTTPGTVSTLSSGGGTEGYNTGVTISGGGTVDTAFASSGTTGKGGGLDTTLRLLASHTAATSSSVLTLTNNVNIAANTPAANDYTDTITVVGAGLF